MVTQYEIHPERPSGTESGPETDQRLQIVVVYTSMQATVCALREAEMLAAKLGARIMLVVPQVVPYPLPLESPTVAAEFNEQRFMQIASHSRVETAVRIYLCRDRLETLGKVLSPGSLIVMGGHHRWWSTSEETLMRGLQKQGHEVIFKEVE